MKITKETKKKTIDVISKYAPRFLIACITTSVAVTIIHMITILLNNSELDSLEMTNAFLFVLICLFAFYIIIWVWYKFSDIGRIQEVKIAK